MQAFRQQHQHLQRSTSQRHQQLHQQWRPCGRWLEEALPPLRTQPGMQKHAAMERALAAACNAGSAVAHQQQRSGSMRHEWQKQSAAPTAEQHPQAVGMQQPA